MSRPWRNLAITLFLSTLLLSGLAGDKLLALGGEKGSEMQSFTELLMVAHESYGDDVTYKDLVYGSIQGMLRTLDPHTSFLTPEAYDNMRQRQQGSFFGLGILVSKRNGQLTVISPIEGTPAWRLGLRAGDVISTIEGEPTDTMSLDEAVSKLKGPKDTKVNVTLTRRGVDEPLPVSITRAEIPQNTVRYAYMMTPETAYIRLTDFSRSTAGEMEEALGKLKDEGMDRLILDLRGNGGGLLDQTVTVSGFFVPGSSRIVETRGRVASSYQTFLADEGRDPLDIPLVVLVDEGTASAAEILAGAIQDHDMGLIAGTPTWGKGLVQTVYNLSYGTGIALTTAKYYTPAGRLIQRDYTSYYDYYTHFRHGDGEGEDDETPEVIAEGPEYRTDLGRSVYGGGGITPDVMVDLPNGPVELQPLYFDNALFGFAVDYEANHDITDLSWQPPADFLDRFRDWLLKEEMYEAEEIDKMLASDEAKDLARRQIHADIFNSAFGTEAANRVQSQGDPQIQAALELFDEAVQLLAQRHSVGPDLPPRMFDELKRPSLEATGRAVPEDGVPQP